MPRILPLIALCTALGYTTAWLLPCPEMLRASEGRGFHAHAAATPPPASGEHLHASRAVPRAHAAVGVSKGAAPRPAQLAESNGAPLAELAALCPCGCEDAPNVPAAGGRLPSGVPSVAPALPSTPGHPVWPDAAWRRAGDPGAPIDHVPILS